MRSVGGALRRWRIRCSGLRMIGFCASRTRLFYVYIQTDTRNLAGFSLSSWFFWLLVATTSYFAESARDFYVCIAVCGLKDEWLFNFFFKVCKGSLTLVFGRGRLNIFNIEFAFHTARTHSLREDHSNHSGGMSALCLFISVSLTYRPLRRRRSLFLHSVYLYTFQPSLSIRITSILPCSSLMVHFFSFFFVLPTLPHAVIRWSAAFRHDSVSRGSRGFIFLSACDIHYHLILLTHVYNSHIFSYQIQSVLNIFVFPMGQRHPTHFFSFHIFW